MQNKDHITAFIKIGIVALLIGWTFLLLKPFIGVILWAVILGVALFPAYEKMLAKIKSPGLRKLVVGVLALLVVFAFIMPTYNMFSSVVASSTASYKAIQEGTFAIPSPPETVKEWPLVGHWIYSQWSGLSTDLVQYSVNHKDFILSKGAFIFSAMIGLMGTLLVLILAFVIAIVFMNNADGAYRIATSFVSRLVGSESGTQIVVMARNTIRSVVKGILLVAIIQSLLSFIGFQIFGLPAPGIFALIVLLCAIVQLPVTLAVIPPIIIAFATAESNTTAIIFTVYIVLVSLIDNFLKPILLSKGLRTPTVIIFIGAIGGVMLHGLVGLFIGPVVLAVIHQLYMGWTKEEFNRKEVE